MLLSYHNMIRIAFALYAIILITAGSIFAQDSKGPKLTDDEIASLTSKLSKKILLNQNQNNLVTTILKEYSRQLEVINSPSTNAASYEIQVKQLISSADEKIKGLLDEKQLMKYNIISNDWWKELIKEESD